MAYNPIFLLIIRSFCSIFFFILLLTINQNVFATHIAVEIQVEGVKGELLTNVLAYISLEQQKKHPRLSDRRIKRLHKQASEEIKQALQPFGYYRVNVTSELTAPKDSDKELKHDDKEELLWQAKYIIDLGEPLTIQTVEVLIIGDAEQDSVFQKQLANFPIKVGDKLNHSDYEKAKRVLSNLAEERGYFDAQFTQHKIRIDEAAYTAHIALSFDSKQRYIFGNVIFKQDLFNESLLQRFLTFKSGDYYTGNQFDVDIAHSSSTDDLHLPVDVTLEPRKRNKYAAGIGYGTDTGVRGFSAKTELSEIRRSVTTRYSIPMGADIDNFIDITAGYKDESTDTSDSEVFLVGISKNHARSLFDFNLSEVIGIEYRDEKYAIGSDTGHAKLLMPNINWSYVKADNRIYTLRVIARGDVGYSVISLLDGDFHDLPPSIRFFAGGDRSVRGYDYQALGPKNLEGQVIGGKNLLVGSIEYEHKIIDKWSLAIFYDVGNAFNDFSEPLKHGTGVGVRWQSPVGLIRVDVATALSESGTPLRLHITIGPDL